jgi:uncharacterized alkaline shock family protein YloU
MEVNSKIDLGAVKIHKNVIASIASLAALENEGVKRIASFESFDVGVILGLKKPKGIKVEFGKHNEMCLEIPLIVKYGYNIPEIAEGVQDSVRQALEKMLDKSPRDIRINIQGIEK